ncbi:unnamed protein product [Allacma fusca]|uniref:Uncharacterized protein n=1 Tax=Allacma fusca TaxID=39272 RepID=A0A8J2JYL8_9HEXA|nr:unnamed protein product [Allacma fusca]
MRGHNNNGGKKPDGTSSTHNTSLRCYSSESADPSERVSLLPSTNHPPDGLSGGSHPGSNNNGRSPPVLLQKAAAKFSPRPRAKSWFSTGKFQGSSLAPPKVITSSADGDEDDTLEESNSDSTRNKLSGSMSSSCNPVMRPQQLCLNSPSVRRGGYENTLLMDEQDPFLPRSKSPSTSQKIVYNSQGFKPRRRSLARDALHAIYYLNSDSPPRTVSAEFGQKLRRKSQPCSKFASSSFNLDLLSSCEGGGVGCPGQTSLTPLTLPNSMMTATINNNNCNGKDHFGGNSLSPRSDHIVGFRTQGKKRPKGSSASTTGNSFIVEEVKNTNSFVIPGISHRRGNCPKNSVGNVNSELTLLDLDPLINCYNELFLSLKPSPM